MRFPNLQTIPPLSCAAPLQLRKNQISVTRAGGFCLYSCGFNRQANVKLTPKGLPCPYEDSVLSCYASNFLVKAAGEQGRGFEYFYPALRICKLNAL
jgi:hypothetical protein